MSSEQNRIPMVEDAPATPAAVIHPLLHPNTSDLSCQRFSSSFSGQEFFLSDHIVKGSKVLPAVVHLEMARVAVERSAGTMQDQPWSIRLENMVWIRPLSVNGNPAQVHIELFPEDSQQIGFEIYSPSQDNGNEPVVHSQGRAVIAQQAEVPALDLDALKKMCSKSKLTSKQCYAGFKSIGMDCSGQQKSDTKLSRF